MIKKKDIIGSVGLIPGFFILLRFVPPQVNTIPSVVIAVLAAAAAPFIGDLLINLHHKLKDKGSE